MTIAWGRKRALLAYRGDVRVRLAHLFVEIFVDTALAECERRDPKGLYAKARGGGLINFTGIDSVYEPPEAPDLHLRTAELDVEREVDLVVDALRRRSVFSQA
jgi:bifunctional enzyme CysN/CysC